MKQVVSIFTVLIIALAGVGFVQADSGSAGGDAVLPIVEIVNINEADADTIATALHRVGLKRAQDIVNWRETNGRFTSIEQLLEVKGIGKATLEANRDRIQL